MSLRKTTRQQEASISHPRTLGPIAGRHLVDSCRATQRWVGYVRCPDVASVRIQIPTVFLTSSETLGKPKNRFGLNFLISKMKRGSRQEFCALSSQTLRLLSDPEEALGPAIQEKTFPDQSVHCASKGNGNFLYKQNTNAETKPIFPCPLQGKAMAAAGHQQRGKS